MAGLRDGIITTINMTFAVMLNYGNARHLRDQN